MFRVVAIYNFAYSQHFATLGGQSNTYTSDNKWEIYTYSFWFKYSGVLIASSKSFEIKKYLFSLLPVCGINKALGSKGNVFLSTLAISVYCDCASDILLSHTSSQTLENKIFTKLPDHINIFSKLFQDLIMFWTGPG